MYIKNIDDKLSYFNNLILMIFHILTPLKTVKNKKYKPPWLTDIIKLMIKMRDKAFKKYKNTGKPEHWDYYKQMRNQTNIAIQHEKKRYLEFCTNKHNNKVLWKKLKNLNITNNVNIRYIPDSINNPTNINNFFLQFSKNNTSVDKT